MSATASDRAGPRFSGGELRTAARTGTAIGLWVGSATVAVYQVVASAQRGWIGVDAHAYWVAFRSSQPYDQAPHHVDAFEYSPLFQQVGRPLCDLPFDVYLVAWMAVEATVYVALTRGVAWVWRVPVLLLCVPEVQGGNIYGFFSLALVVGLRAPETWAFPALTKMTPAGTGVVWFAARGEWRRLLRVGGSILALTAVSATIQPQLWRAWIHYLHVNGSGEEAWILARCAVSAVVAVVGARKNWPWVLPYAFIFCAPVQGGFAKDFAMLPATIHLWRHRSARSREEPA